MALHLLVLAKVRCYLKASLESFLMIKKTWSLDNREEKLIIALHKIMIASQAIEIFKQIQMSLSTNH